MQGVCTEAGMYALRERRVHVTQEDFELAVAKVSCYANAVAKVSCYANSVAKVSCHAYSVAKVNCHAVVKVSYWLKYAKIEI